MKREFLEGLGLEKDIIDKIMAEHGKGINTAKGDLETVKTELENAKSTVAERDKQLKELKKSAGDNEELKNKISELQADNEKQKTAYAEQIKQLKIEGAVERAIRDAGGRNVKAVRALIDIDSEKVKVNDKGELEGLDISAQLETLKGAEDSSFLFSAGTFKGVQPASSGESSKRDEFPENGSYEDMAAYFEAHPESN